MNFQGMVIEFERLKTKQTEIAKEINAKIDEAHSYRETLLKQPEINPQSVDKLNTLQDELLSLHASSDEYHKQITDLEAGVKQQLSLLVGKKVVIVDNRTYKVWIDDNGKLIITE